MNSLGYSRRFNWAENGSLAIATGLSCIMAGIFWAYAFHFGQAMLNLDGATFTQVQITLHQFTRQFEYSALFFGTAIMLMVAVMANARCWNSFPFWLMVFAALIYFFGVLYFTQQISRPLTFTIDEWGNELLPDDWQHVRNKWIYANQFRFIAASGAFIACLLAFVIRANQAPKA